MAGGVCKLCLNTVDKFVDSHIIPRAFYEGIERQGMLSVSENNLGGKNTRRLKKGLYGQFLCHDCEKRFNQYDEPAIKLFKQNSQTKQLVQEGNKSACVIENAVDHKDIIHKFALSVLWRASVCGQREYKELSLGSYNEPIRESLLTGEFSNDLFSKAGMVFEKCQGDQSAGAFVPYKRNENNKALEETFGRFHCHTIGFPFGKFEIRLGGDNPRQGYFQIDENFGELSEQKGVIWSCNLSTEYPHLFFGILPPSDNSRLMSFGVFPSSDNSRLLQVIETAKTTN